MNIVSIVLGLGASAGFIATNYILNRTWMLIVQTTAILLVSTQYGLAGVWSVVAVNAVLLLRNLIFFRTQLSSRAILLMSLGFGVMLTIVTLSVVGVPSSILDWLALGAGYCNIAAFATMRTLGTKIGLGASSLSWATFNAIQGNWQNVIGDAFGTIAAAIAIARLTFRRD